ncbi:MAG TPA: hypothetical protein VK658_20605, partial [Chryseolinea sp.]|nr:hypothetical protein [Chryseolinea sp.]
MTISGNVTLKKGKAFSIERRHPWVFSGAIQQMDHSIHDGSWVRVMDEKGNVLATGHYQSGSIAVRILTFGPDTPDDRFWEQRIEASLTVRNSIGLPNERTNCFRLIHGEGDSLPGLIIDYYDGVAVIQAHSLGMHVDRERIAQALNTVFKHSLRAVYYKSHSTLPKQVDDTTTKGYLLGMGGVPHVVLEHGNKYFIDWEEGQKTGFFLDQ